jgi:hypothetical protein
MDGFLPARNDDKNPSGRARTSARTGTRVERTVVRLDAEKCPRGRGFREGRGGEGI